MGSEDWKKAAKELARGRATEESRELWRQRPGEVPLFNYRWEHLLAVVELCETLGKQVGADLEVLEAAAWLHDIVKSHSIDQPAQKDAMVAAEEARRFLGTTGFPAAKVDPVCAAIRLHEGLHLDQPMLELESAVLWDADKLSKLGATHLVHTLCIRPAFDPVFQGQPTDTALVVRTSKDWLRLAEGIVESMNTEPGKAEAAGRLAFLREFTAELEREWPKS